MSLDPSLPVDTKAQMGHNVTEYLKKSGSKGKSRTRKKTTTKASRGRADCAYLPGSFQIIFISARGDTTIIGYNEGIPS